MDLKNEKAIVLLSGGQDSTTCLFWALSRFKEVVAIGFNYGQKHLVELHAARTIAKMTGVVFKIFDCKGLLGGSALTEHGLDVSGVHEKNQNLPASFTAGRNALFLTVAASYGHAHGIQHIITGVCQTDFSGYPDCRQVFITSMQSTMELALDSPVTIHTPLMYLTKAETWKLARELSAVHYDNGTLEGVKYDVVEIVRQMTITDYNGDLTMNDWGRGRLDNPASELRSKGYLEAKQQGWI
jgi:7-cyano-7-deazaguanine synthase